jgi:murein L,D-transpeptidase YafK
MLFFNFVKIFTIVFFSSLYCSAQIPVSIVNMGENTSASNTGNYIIVDSTVFTLNLYDNQNNLIKSYSIGLGKNGMGKTKQGDKKTPIGTYQIIWKASRFWQTDGGYPIIDGQAFAGPDSMFTTDPKIGYDDEKLWTDSYGGQEAVVMCINYPNISDKLKNYTGDCIEIHATQLGGIGEYASAGCVRMNPADARDLYQYVTVGTNVIIR